MMFRAEPIADSSPSDDHSRITRPISPRVEAGPRRSFTTWTMSDTDWPGNACESWRIRKLDSVCCPTNWSGNSSRNSSGTNDSSA